MKRRTAIQRMGGGLAAVFLGACADGSRLLSPVVEDSKLGPSRKPGRKHTNKVVGHTIFVTVEDTSITVVPETLTMTTLDNVRFSATNGRGFSIVFDDRSPFETRELSFDEARSRQGPRVKGQFKYTVISTENPNLLLDPVIVVEEPPSDSKP